MGQRSKPAIWFTRGGWRWKEEENIREKEAPEWEGSENWEENTLATRIGLVIKFKRNTYKN